MESRLPRFKRASAVAPLQLTVRDRQIIRLVHRHRFLRSHQIIALLGGSPQQLLRRLKLLYHHGYLERPRAQLQYYEHGGSRSIAYGLGNKGWALLRQERGVAFREVSWGEKNRAVGRMFLEHALLVSEVMVAIELACRRRGIRLVTERELALPGKRQPFQWRVKIQRGLKLGVGPDRVFALEFPDASGQTQRVHFFLEADRGTMPVKRRNLSQTSFFRKLLAYEATWTQNLHRSRFGFHRFRVLTVTTSAARVKSLVEACSQLERGHGLFLFADRDSLLAHESFLSFPFQTGRPPETATLMAKQGSGMPGHTSREEPIVTGP
jgi:DNA-binding Lrp family transcriptional regulator